jgi:UrcA family protein
MRGIFMRSESPIRRGTRLALLAASVAVTSGPALGQESTKIQEVEVHAGGPIRVERPTTGKHFQPPTETAEITMHVSYADLPLDSNSGQALLKQRVEDAAIDACARVRFSGGQRTTTSDAQCIKTAYNQAMAQVNTAIASANSEKVNR